jgi:undecaprenyl pyrophosphate phosphatase UppP
MTTLLVRIRPALVVGVCITAVVVGWTVADPVSFLAGLIVMAVLLWVAGMFEEETVERRKEQS